MSLVINQALPVVSAPGATTDVVLQPGSVITAKVLQTTGDQVRISIGAQSIDVQTQVPLQAGQSLQLAVSQTADGIRLAVLPQAAASAAQALAPAGAGSDILALAPDAAISLAAQAPAVALASLLTPQEAQAVATAAQGAATQQTSMAPLFANLAAAAGLDSLPPQLQQAVAQVLAQRPSLDQNLSGADVQRAFQGSGLFLEASLASGTAPSASAPDLKAALIVLRQVLTASLNRAPEPGALPQPTAASAQGAPTIVQPPEGNPAGSFLHVLQPDAAALAPVSVPQGDATAVAEIIADLSPENPVAAPASTATAAATRAAAGSAALSLLQEAVQANSFSPVNAARLALGDGLQLSLLPAAAGLKTPRGDDGTRSLLPPPPIRGALPAAQPVAAVTIVANDPPQATLRHLLHDADAAIARQTLLQVASLPERNDVASARSDAATPRWNFEIPFALPQGTAIAQFEISRDGAHDHEGEAAKQVWRARFSLDIEPAGPVHALVSLQGDRTSVRMWAERPATALQLQSGAAQLSQALIRAELGPGDIVIREGAPPRPAAPAMAGHFLDRAS